MELAVIIFAIFGILVIIGVTAWVMYKLTKL